MTWRSENTVNQAAAHFADRLHTTNHRRNRVFGWARSQRLWNHMSVSLHPHRSVDTGRPSPRPWVPGGPSAPQDTPASLLTAHLLQTLVGPLPQMSSSCIDFKEPIFACRRGGESSHVQKTHSSGRNEEGVAEHLLKEDPSRLGGEDISSESSQEQPPIPPPLRPPHVPQHTPGGSALADPQGQRAPREGVGAPRSFAGAPPLRMDLMSSVSK